MKYRVTPEAGLVLLGDPGVDIGSRINKLLKLALINIDSSIFKVTVHDLQKLVGVKNFILPIQGSILNSRKRISEKDLRKS